MSVFGVGGMQEPCAERQCEAASPALEGPPEPPATSPPPWTPEHFLQSTLHEGKGVVCLTPEVTNGERNGEQSGEQNGKPPRGRRKQQWKLKFHHQALPPEYLDHYEASLSKVRPMAAPPPHTTSSAAQTDLTPPPFYDINHLPSESIQNWLQRITSIQNDLQRASTPIANIPSPSPSRRRRAPPVQTETSTPPAVSKVVNYRDLPYMGEMTLNNSKPRRGRKPKKADICHLIYKNYGTIFPGTPGHLVDDRLNGTAGMFDKNIQIKREKGEKLEPLAAPNKQRTDLQNKIISSLLEKRLSQENKKHKDVKVKKNKNIQVEEEDESITASLRLRGSPPSTPATPTPPSISEPLNLCVRDLNNLKIRLLRKHGNVYAKASVETKIEPDRSDNESENCGDEKSPSDPLPGTSAPDSVSPTPRMNIPDFKKALQEATSGESDISALPKTDLGAESPLPGGYVYWPNAGVFVHPLALQSQLLYYQGLAAGSSYTLPPDTASPDSPKSVRLDRSTPIPIELEHRSSPGGSSEGSAAGSRLKRGPNRGAAAAPAKRKRSAIFIPPMPSESGSSPATEVSICKFKFTGGARPSLQEKKMLSVDSGGNFRYYSGTGDKANRGYEFFPRESLPQSVGAGAGVEAGGGPPRPPPARPEDPARRKRKSRKSLQREKLEQTFKEKGFLIQTQQLESAEGATYCKFRQLRKFTRYLFRSWKDYLPGAIQESEAAPMVGQTLTPPSPGRADWP